MNGNERAVWIAMMAQKSTEDMTADELRSFYFGEQCEYLNSLSDKMLLSEIKESGYDIIGNVGNN